MQTMRLEGRVLHVPLHVEHFDQRIRHGRSGGRHVWHLGPEGIEQPARLDEQIERLGRTCWVTHAWVAVHGGVVGEVLKFVHLVQEHGINAQLVKRHHLVALTDGGQLVLHFGFEIGADLLHVPDDVAVATASFHFLHGFGNFVNLLLQYRLLCFLWKPDLFEAGVTNHHGIPVPGDDLGEHALAIALAEVLRRCRQDVCPWVQARELAAPLQRQVIGHHEHRFTGDAKAAHFHG